MTKTLPKITRIGDRYRVTIAAGCHLEWWIERRDEYDHHMVRLIVPAGIPVDEIDEGYVFNRPSRH